MLRQRARNLRRNMTDAERLLWRYLRDRQLHRWKFRRQHLIEPFIVDFVCLEQKLIIEIDGGQHALNEEADRKRSNNLIRHGYKIVRFWNNEVLKNIDSVLEVILSALSESPSPQPSPPRGEGE